MAETINTNTPKELDLALDGFGQQKYLTEAQSSARQIVQLLLMRPGDMPSIPDAGINISRVLRFKDMDVITGSSLKENISEPIRKYCPSIDLSEVTVYSTTYQSQYVVIIDFEVQAETTISVALSQATGSLFTDFIVDFN